jgi:octaprenyl-diphosphate synthase
VIPTAAAEVTERNTPALLASLESIVHDRGIGALAARIAELRLWIDSDMREVESELLRFDRRETPLHKSAEHLLTLEGKRLRPLCLVFAARLGTGFSPAVRDLGVAVELVHNATLLHDDVVDLGDKRRGSDTARVIYGNAASIYAGDWLLVEALSRTRASGYPDLLDSILSLLKHMLDAEALQLRNRGKVHASAEDYFSVIEGKTASLFEWALRAGGRAGGLDEAACNALASYGQNLGIAFQLVDDALDFSGDAGVVGKSLLSDLREGKMTGPLLFAIERDPSLARTLEASCDGAGTALDPITERRVATVVRETGALAHCTRLALQYSTTAIEQLALLPQTPATEALHHIAVTMVHRVK